MTLDEFERRYVEPHVEPHVEPPRDDRDELFDRLKALERERRSNPRKYQPYRHDQDWDYKPRWTL